MDEDSLMRKILSGELLFAKVWLVCVALRGVSWDKMPFEQRELAFQAKEAASSCLATFLQSPEYRYVGQIFYNQSGDSQPRCAKIGQRFDMQFMTVLLQRPFQGFSYSRSRIFSLQRLIYPLLWFRSNNSLNYFQRSPRNGK